MGLNRPSIRYYYWLLIARIITKKELKKNPPINEKMIEVMMSGMGRKPSQKQVKQVMAQMSRYQ